MKTRRLFAPISAGLCLLVPGLVRAADVPAYQDASAPLERRVEDLSGRLTPDEKLSLLGGTGFAVEAVPRLGVPKMAMVDAGQGVRGGEPATEGPATAFPAGVLMASTWDTNLIRQVGQAIGEEAANKGAGARVLLGPAVNIHRSPLGGRNGEYFSEDPFLAARLAVAYIQGMQGGGISACVKHFAGNNQETDRDDVNATVSERALREIYLPAFEAAVKEGKVWSVMSSYNLVNGHHSSASSFLLKDVLKTDWGFDGEVMSDWGGVHEADAVQFGNDLEMPTGSNMSVPHLKAALADGSVTQAAVDDSVRRILRTVIRVGLLDGPIQQNPAMVNSPAHQRLALDAAEHGIILLKNSHAVLPLDARRIKSIAVIGEPAERMQFDALGSPEVRPLHVVEFLDGIKTRAGDATVTCAAARLDGEPSPASAILTPDAVAAVKNADVAIVCVSTRRMEGEGSDRPSMDLPANQAGLIRAVAAANKNTVVVLNNGTPVTMKDWLADVPAVVEAWLPGQEGGTALAAILFGDVNPSGKLPDTFAASREDYPDFGNYPGANHQVNYAEGIYVGYRHFDQAGIAPLFPFGYGLSYTTFGYDNLKLSKKKLSPGGSVTASLDITNTGKRAGEEVVELYIHDPKPQIDKPVRELKGFAKVALKPGETKTVQFTVQPRALAYFDTPGHQWKADAGDYEIQVGASSRDLRQKALLHLTADYTDKMPSAK
jgi:beta-glucosidase